MRMHLTIGHIAYGVLDCVSWLHSHCTGSDSVAPQKAELFAEFLRERLHEWIPAKASTEAYDTCVRDLVVKVLEEYEATRA